MTKNIGFNNPIRKNRIYSSNTSVLNYLNKYNTSNISLITSNDFNNTKSFLQINKSFKSRTFF